MSEHPTPSASSAPVDRAAVWAPQPTLRDRAPPLDDTAALEAGPSCPSDSAIVALIVGSVTPAGREPIEAHLAACSDCRRIVSALAPTGMRAATDRKSGAPTLAMGDLVAEKYRLQEV